MCKSLNTIEKCLINYITNSIEKRSFVYLYLGEDIELVAIDPHKDEIALILLRILEQDLGD